MVSAHRPLQRHRALPFGFDHHGEPIRYPCFEQFATCEFDGRFLERLKRRDRAGGDFGFLVFVGRVDFDRLGTVCLDELMA